MKNIAAAATLALSLTPALAAGPNLVVNGSFEADPIAGNSWVIRPNITGWTGAPDIELQNQLEGNLAQDGQQLVELDTFANSAMSQTINATGWVNLSFWYTPRIGWGANTHGVQVSLGGFTGTVMDSVAGGSVPNWQRFSALVDLGSSGSAVLRFAATGTSDMAGGLIDNVSVTAVPEPSTAALSLAGGLVLAAGLRRRRAGR
ncbi:PEP-CTERM sorting domain-containing protein [Roseateles sp. DXS20W]|uniref:PEP-CTERM sorting domain-containing protein n=1 Tax=Pelomonas lactea TaxID=3299030 RepID=A0ABW7GN52_9BURK